MDLKDTYNKIAEDWHKDHNSDDWWVEGTDKFISFLKPGDSVLDVGCGAGVKSKYLINRGLEVVGIDFSEKMIEIAKREVPSGKFLAVDIKDIGKLNEKFDGVFAQAILLHIPKKEIKDTLQILLSKLSQGGYFYIAVKEKKPDKKEEEIKIENEYGYEFKRFFSYFTTREVKGYLKDFNVKICYEDIKPIGKMSWIQIIVQKL